jgi:hypothetical protein
MGEPKHELKGSLYMCVKGVSSKMRGIELGRHRSDSSECTCDHVAASTVTRSRKFVGDNLLPGTSER